MGGHPKNVIMLTADAFGVLPPIARLTPEQAMYHFISGYTAKVAGTERGVTEPQATFSACFGAPFMVHPPGVYAELLAAKIEEHDAKVWLVNTGWTGGPYGVGQRIELATPAPWSTPRSTATSTASSSGRSRLRRGRADHGARRPRRGARPAPTWADGDAYDAQAAKLAGMFAENFEKFADSASDRGQGGGSEADRGDTLDEP